MVESAALTLEKILAWAARYVETEPQMWVTVDGHAFSFLMTNWNYLVVLFKFPPLIYQNYSISVDFSADELTWSSNLHVKPGKIDAFVENEKVLFVFFRGRIVLTWQPLETLPLGTVPSPKVSLHSSPTSWKAKGVLFFFGSAHSCVAAL